MSQNWSLWLIELHLVSIFKNPVKPIFFHTENYRAFQLKVAITLQQ